MNRASVEKHRENIRISRDAVKKGISFKRVGKSMIEHYKTCPNVEHVQVIFITEPLEAFSTLTGIARREKDHGCHVHHPGRFEFRLQNL